MWKSQVLSGLVRGCVDPWELERSTVGLGWAVFPASLASEESLWKGLWSPLEPLFLETSSLVSGGCWLCSLVLCFLRLLALSPGLVTGTTKSSAGRGHRLGKGLEVGRDLVCSRYRGETIVSRAQMIEWQSSGRGVGEVSTSCSSQVRRGNMCGF